MPHFCCAAHELQCALKVVVAQLHLRPLAPHSGQVVNVLVRHLAAAAAAAAATTALWAVSCCVVVCMNHAAAVHIDNTRCGGCPSHAHVIPQSLTYDNKVTC
jgi:hypothetical protein